MPKVSKKIDWTTPEQRIKKQNAFRMFAANRKQKDVLEALGVSSSKFFEIKTLERWEHHSRLWRSEPDKELPYPWEVENVQKIVPTSPMETMDKDRRRDCIKAFGMYCSGRPIVDIAEDINVSVSTIGVWRSTQRWDVCRDRLIDAQNPAPWEVDGVPLTMSDLTASLEAMKQSVKFLTGKVLTKAAEAAQDLDGMESLGMMRNIKQLAEAAAINFSDGASQHNAVQINIATKLDSIKIPDKTYEAELVINE